MKTLFVKFLITILFASFVLPAGYEINSQQDPKNKDTQIQKKDRQRLRDGSCDGTFKRKKKGKKNNKKVKKNKKQRKGRT